MKELYLHAIDLATAGELDAAHRALDGIDDSVAARMRDLFAEMENGQQLQARAHSLLRHEIGNALSIAQANLEGIMDGVLPATPERYGGMRNALESAGRLLDDWRRPPRSLEEKAQAIRIADFNICAIIGAQAAVIDGLARAKNVTVYYEPCGKNHSECTHYRGDAQRTGQVLRNVLINAVRYTPPGGRVEIICDRPGAEITLVVRDNGPGIKRDDVAHVFEEGFRGKTAGTVKGSGIGLSVVSHLLAALGGKARVISEEGNGATFIIELPAAPLPASV